MKLPLSNIDSRFAAFLLSAGVFLVAVKISLLAPLFFGLLTYALVIALSRRLTQSVAHSRRAKVISAWIVAATVPVLLVGLGLFLHSQFNGGKALQNMMGEMGKILGSARTWLPASAAQLLPEQNDLLQAAATWLREHAALVGAAGLGTLKTMGYVLVGIFLGAMIGVTDVSTEARLGPASQQLVTQAGALRDAFWRVAFAQLKISVLNTILTGLYLLVILPLSGIHLPFTKTLLIVTFVAGLLPVLGNLISNTIIVIISLSASLGVALASLVFLILIHKLEYFANARIVGGEIRARAWEILLCMLVMERIFGLAGVIAGPVFYAWLKDEWHRWDSKSASVAKS